MKAPGQAIVTAWFAVLHVPKTGGTFVREALARELDDDWLVPTPRRSHLRWEEVVAIAGDVPVLAFVRNPWDWYVSRFHYLKQTKPELRDEFIRNATFPEMVEACCTGHLAQRDADLFTHRFDSIVGAGARSDRLTVGRYERLVADLVAFLEASGAPLPDGLGARLAAAPRARASEHDHYRAYYTPELRDLVAARCPLVERFGYEF